MKQGLFPRLVLWAVMLFLLGPFIIVFLAGFSGGETLAFPPPSIRCAGSWRCCRPTNSARPSVPAWRSACWRP
jgi:ABC-type spermidine/putrescine transport system permease subunit II